jgi:hypothetical protein
MAKDLNLDLLKQGLPGIHAELPVDLDTDSRIHSGGAE